MPQVAEKKKSGFSIEERGFQFLVDTSADSMLASLTITASDNQAIFNFKPEELKNILNQAGIIAGIKEDQLQNLAQSPALNKKIEVARGKQPDKGIDAGFELLFDPKSNKAPAVGADGHIDYKNLNLITNAKIGQPLARKKPAAAGAAGFTVTGEEIPSQIGKDHALPKGKNTDISPDDPDLLVASENGSVQFVNNIVIVEKDYKLLKDVDIATGNIKFVGNLQITGTVKSGFSVLVDGNLSISKNVEDSIISSGGSVTIEGGFINSGNGYIRATEDVAIRFIENGKVEAGHDINIGGEVINSNISAGNAIFVKGKKAVILGGQTAAYNLIETDSIGSDMGTKTLVRVGYNPEILREYQHIDSEIKRLKSDTERIKQALYSLVRLEMDSKLSPDQQEMVTKLKACRDAIPGQIEELEQQKAELLKKLEENKGAKIVVRGTAFHGTVIQIGMLKKELNQDVTNCAFMVDRDQIITISHR
jgi:uncharacterized protein